MFSVSPLVINISPRAIDASNLFGSEAFNPLRQQRKGHICVFFWLRQELKESKCQFKSSFDLHLELAPKILRLVYRVQGVS